MRRVVSACLVLVVIWPAGRAGDGPVPVSIDKLPKSVVQTIKAKYPKAQLLSAGKETADGESHYLVNLKADAESFRLTLTPRGKLLESSRKVDLKYASKYVELALRKNYPGAKVDEARERIVDPGKANKKTFIVTITTPANKKLEVTFDPRGSVLEEKELKELKKFDQP